MIKDWLAKVRPPKYLRYLFFISYCWYRKYSSERNEAHFTAILILALGKIGMISGLFFFSEVSAWFIICLVVIFFYFLFWYKKKWLLYLEEFKHIKRRQQKVGLIYLLTYLLISICVGFYPVIIDFLFNIRL